MLVFFTNLIPFATDKEILIPEKLPGPEFTKIEKSLFKSMLYFFIKLAISNTNISFLIRLVCNFLIKNLLSFFNAIKLFLPVQSITKKSLIIFLLFIFISAESSSVSDNIKDNGVIVLMYHRFNENKYPSTNIKLPDFIKQIDLIKKNGFDFLDADSFEDSLKNQKNQKKILLTIDDAFMSFYNQAWPILKKT